MCRNFATANEEVTNLSRERKTVEESNLKFAIRLKSGCKTILVW